MPAASAGVFFVMGVNLVSDLCRAAVLATRAMELRSS
jgi:hypothetical protein